MIKEVPYSRKVKSEELKQIFINVIKEQVSGESKVGLMLSGGVDSASILYALFELGVEVHPYTFYLEEYESKDLLNSQELTDKYGLDLTLVRVPVDNIILDFKKLYEYGCYKKTHFETKIHYLYLLPTVTEKKLFYGVNADYWYGLIKNMVINGRNNSEKFNELREKRWIENQETQYPIDQRIADEYDVQLYDPYGTIEVYNYLRQFDWEYLNKPYPKWIIVEAFKDYFIRDGVKPHSNFQIESGMRDYCKTLVNDKTINVNCKKSPVGLYNDLMKKWRMENDGQTTL